MSIFKFILAIGLPSSVVGSLVGFWFHRLQKRLDREAAERQQLEETRKRYELFQVRMLTAVTSLCEANALALQKGKCNGETHKALDYVKQVKHDQREFLVSQGIENMF